MARSALAPPERRIDLNQILKQAVNPDALDAREDSVDDILRGLDQLNRRRTDVYEVADEYYDGDVGVSWASAKVQAMLARSGIEDIPDFRYARRVVKAFADRLQVSSVVAAPAEENEGDQKTTEDAATDAANKVIARLRKLNQLDAEEKRLHLLVSKHGEAYLFLWPRSAEDSPDGKDSVDMRVNSAQNVIMIYDEEDALRALYALKSWETTLGGGRPGQDSETAKKTVTRANLYYSTHVERWATAPGAHPDKRESWYRIAEVPDIDEEDFADLAADEFTDPDDTGYTGDADDEGDDELGPDDIPNPFGRVPFFHFRNDRPHGEPEHASAYGPQLLINKLVNAHAGMIDFQQVPQRYLLMDPQLDDPMSNMSDPIHPDEDDEDPEDEGGSSPLTNGPGELWKLWGKAVGEFTPMDPNNILGPVSQYVGMMSDLTGLPRYALTRAASDLPSGEAAREMNADLNSAIADRQDRYDPQWQDSYEEALKHLGITNVTVDVRWKPIQQVNDNAGWAVVQAKIAAGVPPRVALEEAGYAPEQVSEWLKDAEGADLGRRVALLGQIGTAVQTIGAGIAMGAVSAEMAQQVVAAVLKMTLAGAEVDGTEIVLPDPADSEFVDPQAALKAAQDMQAKQQEHQAGMQKAQLDHAKQSQGTQLDHATQTQETAQQHAARMAAEGHERAKEMMGGPADPGKRPGRGPGGKR